MTDNDEMLSAILEIRDLIRIMAEPAIAEHDKKSRAELRRIVGRSEKKAAAVFLMDGSRIQTAIHKESGINPGDLSTLVKQLTASSLLSGDAKQPKLSISIPNHFFENEAD
jgi:nitrogenase molybdenum-iron protein alpha/beta subunit